MTKTSFIAKVTAAAAALVAAATASAEGTFTPEPGIGGGCGKEVGIQGDRQSMFGTAAFGCTADNGLGGRVILVAANHYAMEVLVSHLTTSDLTTATPRFQVAF
jgi:hypothetical protein